jgi:hypothetical protein
MVWREIRKNEKGKEDRGRDGARQDKKVERRGEREGG